MPDKRNEKLTRAELIAELESLWEECARDEKNFSAEARAELEIALHVLRLTYSVGELFDLETLCQA